MRMRILSLVLLLAAALSLTSAAPACCSPGLDCCADEAASLPAPTDDCCSIAGLSESIAVSAPLVPQIAPCTVPALACGTERFAASMTPATAAIPSPVPPRFRPFEILRN